MKPRYDVTDFQGNMVRANFPAWVPADVALLFYDGGEGVRVYIAGTGDEVCGITDEGERYDANA